tara:strand:- start:184 stop:363 length:180 start_codon:yes stop_codon:yes gene_type:complete
MLFKHIMHNLSAQGIAKDLKPMMHKLIGVFPRRMQGGGAGPSNGAAAPGHKGVKRMRGD